MPSWFMACCLGHVTSVHLARVWCVLLTWGCYFIPDIFQLYTQMSANRTPAPLYSLYSMRAPWPALVLQWVFVLGTGPTWTSILCVGLGWLRKLMVRGPLWALSEATSHPTSECSSVSLINPVTPSKPPISDSHVLWLNTRMLKGCALPPSPPSILHHHANLR